MTDAEVAAAPAATADAERLEAVLAELRELRPKRDEAQAQLDYCDGRRWDLFTEARALGAKNGQVAKAWGVSEPAVIQALKKDRPVPLAERNAGR